MQLGIWIDDPVKDVVTAEYWDTLVDHGFSTAALMLEGMGKGFDPNYDLSVLERIRGLAHTRDVEIVLTVWPEPSVHYLQEFEARIGPMLKAAGAAGLEFDCEGNWLPIKVKGFANIDQAGDKLVDIFTRVCQPLDIRTEVTTYPYHTENSRTADVAPHADRLLPQAYSVRNRDSGGKPVDVKWTDTLGPGNAQKLTLDRALLVPGVGKPSGPMISCGLAAYDQVWSGKSPEEAMKVAYDAAVNYNPMEIRYWSSKWVFGIRENKYASRFIKSLKG